MGQAGLWPVNENEVKKNKNEYFARIYQGVFSVQKTNKLKLKNIHKTKIDSPKYIMYNYLTFTI
jgi:hypothetical protein